MPRAGRRRGLASLLAVAVLAATSLAATTLAAMTLAAMTLAAAARPAVAHELWFGVVSNLPTPRGFETDPDFPDLFTKPELWRQALSRVKVMKFTRRWVMTAPENEVRRTFAFLRAHDIGVAAVFGMVEAKGCGERIEGMVHGPGRNIGPAKRFRELGADVRYIVADEPLTFGHYHSKGDACRYSIEQTAASYADNIRQVKSVFPRAVVVDTEATNALNSAADLGHWFDLLKQQLGADAPAYLHLDVQWERDSWQSKAGWIVSTARQHGLGYGIIYHGTAQDRTDQAWIGAVKQHIVDWERAVPDRADQVTIQSWNPNPTHVLPETDPTSLTSLVDWYCEHTTANPGCR